MEAKQHEQPSNPADTAAEIRQILSQGIDDKGSEGDREALGEEAQGADDGGIRVPDEHEPGEPDTAASLEDDAQGDEDNADTGADEPVDLEFLAGELDVDKADLYELEIPLGDGQKTTLGELKDAYKEYGPVREAQERVTQEKEALERDKLTTISAWNAVGSVIDTPEKQALWQQMEAAAKHQQEAWRRKNQEIIRDTIPEWSDPDQLHRDRDAIVDLGREYGFSPPEMTATHDARTLLMLRDHARLRAKVAELQKAPERKRAKPNAVGKKSSGKLTKRRLAQRRAQAKAAPHLSQKAGFVRDLLDGNS